ncbi:Ig-like domain-containing protein, partial [candidate division KSB1 bacterium]
MKTIILFSYVLLNLLLIDFVIAQNNSFVGVNDTIYTKAGTPITIDVLKNDTFPNVGTVKITNVSYLNGTGINTDSTIIYTPSHYFKGIDTISYRILIYPPYALSNIAYVIAHVDNDCFDTLNINNVNAAFASYGNYFWRRPDGYQKYYEIPSGSGKHTLFTSVLWIGGLDNNNVVHFAGERYRQVGEDFWPGPVMNKSAYCFQIDSIWNKTWKIDKAEIEYHKNHYTTTGYMPINDILYWPGNGDINSGQASKLAPFIDLNNDGIYDPNAGDYPRIRGDQSVFYMFNDDRNFHTESQGIKLGVEVYVTAYAFDCPIDSAFDKSIFFHYEIFNRSDTSYQDCYLGLFVDFNIGYNNDDFVGCDSILNSFYGYNGKSDDGYGAPDHYGMSPPAQGITFLSLPMAHFIYFRNTGSGAPQAMQDPIIASEYYNYLKGIWRDSTHLKYGGNGWYGAGGSTVNCNFQFPGDPTDSLAWTEFTASNVPFDRRGLGSIGPINLHSDSTFSFDVAYIYARDHGGTNLSSVILLKQYISQIQQAYDNDSTPCGKSFSGLSDLWKEQKELVIFPVPTNDILYIKH